MNAHTVFGRLAAAALVMLASSLALADDDHGKNHRTWKGSGTGGGVSVSPEGIITIAFSGNSGLLGNYTADGAHSFRNALSFKGFVVFTADDGDQLDARYEGKLDLKDVRDGELPGFKGELEVVGGTGKFRHASGSAKLNGQDRTDSTFVLSFHGNVWLSLHSGRGDNDDRDDRDD